MVSFKILEMNRFMGKLLKGELFDTFLVKEGFVRTLIEYKFQGHLFPDYFDTQEKEERTEEYAYWNELKPFVLELVKGKRTPLAFSFTMLLNQEQKVNFLEKYALHLEGDNPTLALQIRFEHGTGRIVTATARNTFSMDRSLEESWDREVKELLLRMEIAVEAE